MFDVATRGGGGPRTAHFKKARSKKFGHMYVMKGWRANVQDMKKNSGEIDDVLSKLNMPSWAVRHREFYGVALFVIVLRNASGKQDYLVLRATKGGVGTLCPACWAGKCVRGGLNVVA